MKKGLLIGLFLLLTIVVIGQVNNYPKWFLKVMIKFELDSHYEISLYIKPAFLLSDFDSVNCIDCAALMIEKSTKKVGVLHIHSKVLKFNIYGTGQDFGYDSDNFFILVNNGFLKSINSNS